MKHLADFGKSYATKDEYEFRLALFAKKHIEMAKINSTNGSFTVGHNMFSDWTQEEFQKLLGYKKPEKHLIGGDGHDSYVYLPVEDTPNAIDWRDKGAVNAVKN